MKTAHIFLPTLLLSSPLNVIPDFVPGGISLS